VRRLMMLGVLALLLWACQDGYPLEPTACDDWCYQTQRVLCWDEDPADCVASCEEFGRPQDPECMPLWEDVLRCYSAQPDNAGCGPEWEPLCEAEQQALGECQWPGDER
jgi:hypothetical protein